jgi:hypothetical protein
MSSKAAPFSPLMSRGIRDKRKLHIGRIRESDEVLGRERSSGRDSPVVDSLCICEFANSFYHRRSWNLSVYKSLVVGVIDNLLGRKQLCLRQPWLLARLYAVCSQALNHSVVSVLAERERDSGRERIGIGRGRERGSIRKREKRSEEKNAEVKAR